MHEAHQASKMKLPKGTELPRICMEKANAEFENYQASLHGNSADTPKEAYQKYQTARDKITGDMHKTELDK